MKLFSWMPAGVLLALCSLPALADDDNRGDGRNERLDRRGDAVNERLDDRGDSINERLDRRGEAINERLDRQAERARSEGKEAPGGRPDRRGGGLEERPGIK